MAMIEYTTATALAGIYARNVPLIVEKLAEIEKLSGELKEAFGAEYAFDVDLYHKGHHSNNDDRAREKLAHEFKLSAWGCLFTKLGIWKILSEKRASGLRSQLEGKSHQGESVDPLPDITEESMLQVLGGMAASVDDFLGEAVREEYDFWKSGPRRLKTNAACDFLLPRKVIHGYMVELGWSGGRFHVNYGSNGQHVRSIDNIFHALAGAGLPEGYNGPLYDAIGLSQDGTGETDFFRFKCYKNGNLHLEFKQPKLLDDFNAIAGRNRLPKSSAA